jgi:ABC-type amino acid transport substrate-binding protein
MIRHSLLAALLLTSAAADAAADLADMKTRGTLRVLVVEGSPEFYAVKPGAPPGLDREVLDGFAGLQRIAIETVVIPSWAELIPALREGRGDLVAGGVTVTEARRKLIDFSAEVFPTRHVVVSRKPSPAIRSVEELREVRVGTIKGSSMAEIVAESRVPPSRVVDTIPSGGMPAAMRSGQVTACVIGVENAIADQRADPEIQIGVFLGPKASLAFGVRKEDAELKRALDDYVSNLRRTPTWNRLVVKYFGDAAVEILRRAQAE